MTDYDDMAMTEYEAMSMFRTALNVFHGPVMIAGKRYATDIALEGVDSAFFKERFKKWIEASNIVLVD